MRCFLPSREPGASPFATWRWLLAKELRELAVSRSYWLLLLVIGALVGHAFITSVDLYAEASGIGGGAAALAQGLSPLEGIVVPTLGVYDLAATLLFPFVVIRLVAADKETGALALMLQAPVPFRSTIVAKGIALVIAWLAAGIAGIAALMLWRTMGGHLYAPETGTVLLGHILRGILTIGISAAAGALAASAASAAIIALTVTLGTWALDYIAAARGGAIASVAAYTPSAALRVFEHGELRVATVLVLLTLGTGGLAVASVWLQQGRPVSRRAAGVAAVMVISAILCVLFTNIRTSRDVSEDRRNSFPRADEAALRAIDKPLRVVVYLAAEDPRLTDLERGVLAKLRRILPNVEVVYAATSRSGLFERPNQHYGEVYYELGGRRAMSRSTTEPIVLETIYELAGRQPPTAVADVSYPGYPLPARSAFAPWLFFVVWPLGVIIVWWLITRPKLSRLRSFGE
jgi:ABC-type transport system involved in multi-copper enzyme maturation permease subunit